MSVLLTCHGIAKSFGAQTLFSNLDLVISDGDRIGLIGPNGSGKSTLLDIISGRQDCDRGEILRRRNTVISHLRQEDELDAGGTALDNLLAVLQNLPLEQAEKQQRAEALLSRAHLDDPGMTVGRLSGGWRKRVAICAALVLEPDLLVMDEPTNHLDIGGIIWLEQLLAAGSRSTPPTLIMVSHDRQFLQNCVQRVVELSRSYPTGTFQVEGGYARFLEKRHEFLAQQTQLEERLANKVRRETEWLRRGPKARTTKAQYRVDEAHRLQDELARLQVLNRADGRVGIDFSETGRKTKKLLEVRDVSKQVDGKTLFRGVNAVLSPNTRLGLVGPNGCGKSTLMKVLGAAGTAVFPPDAGEMRLAEGVRVVSFTQDRSAVDRQATLRRALAPDSDSVVFRGRSVHVVSWAKRFLFRPDQLDTPVSQLSGGEQARILIADLMRQPADILLLDEPTNDLDIASLDVLEESLLEFDGALVLVTHDRYLLDRVCDSILGFTPDGRIEHYADYEQWLQDIDAGRNVDKRPDGRSGAVKKKVADDRPSGRLTYLEQREYEQMEEMILTAENRRDVLEERLVEPEIASNPEELSQCWEELEEARSAVDRLYRRWEELEKKQQ